MAGASGWLFARVRARYITVSLAVGLVASYALMGMDHGALCTTLMVLLASAFGLFSPLMRTLLNRLIPNGQDRATLLSFEGMARRLLFAAASPLFGRAAEASSLGRGLFGYGVGGGGVAGAPGRVRAGGLSGADGVGVDESERPCRRRVARAWRRA